MWTKDMYIAALFDFLFFFHLYPHLNADTFCPREPGSDF